MLSTMEVLVEDGINVCKGEIPMSERDYEWGGGDVHGCRSKLLAIFPRGASKYPQKNLT